VYIHIGFFTERVCFLIHPQLQCAHVILQCGCLCVFVCLCVYVCVCVSLRASLQSSNGIAINTHSHTRTHTQSNANAQVHVYALTQAHAKAKACSLTSFRAAIMTKSEGLISISAFSDPSSESPSSAACGVCVCVSMCCAFGSATNTIIHQGNPLSPCRYPCLLLKFHVQRHGNELPRALQLN
jgi:hypothetical protein